MANSVAECVCVFLEEVYKQDHGLLATKRRMVCQNAINVVNTRLVAELNTFILHPKESAGLWIVQVIVVLVCLRSAGIVARLVPRWLMAFYIVLIARILL